MEARELFRKLNFGKNSELEEEFILSLTCYIASEDIDTSSEIEINDVFAMYSLDDVLTDSYRRLFESLESYKKMNEIKDKIIEHQKIMLELYSGMYNIENLKKENSIYTKNNDYDDVNKSKPSPGFIYIAKQLNESNVYKIGSTINISDREKALKIGNPYLVIVESAKFSNYRNIERKLHGIFAKQRIAGEWFTLDTDDLKFISESYGFNKHIEGKTYAV